METTMSMSSSLAPSAFPFRTSAFQNICGLGYCHVDSVPPLGIVEVTRAVSSGRVWPGAGAWFAVAGIMLVGSIGCAYTL
jgi:hypothetical protein